MPHGSRLVWSPCRGPRYTIEALRVPLVLKVPDGEDSYVSGLKPEPANDHREIRGAADVRASASFSIWFWAVPVILERVGVPVDRPDHRGRKRVGKTEVTCCAGLSGSGTGARILKFDAC